jgi:hypothetical protein
MHEAFLAIITEFVVLPWRHAMQSALDGASQGGSQVSPSIWLFPLLHAHQYITWLHAPHNDPRLSIG